jgi:hypothetical protein
MQQTCEEKVRPTAKSKKSIHAQQIVFHPRKQEKKKRKEAKMWGQLKKSRKDLECGTKQKEKKGEDGTFKRGAF